MFIIGGGLAQPLVAGGIIDFAVGDGIDRVVGPATLAVVIVDGIAPGLGQRIELSRRRAGQVGAFDDLLSQVVIGVVGVEAIVVVVVGIVMFDPGGIAGAVAIEFGGDTTEECDGASIVGIPAGWRAAHTGIGGGGIGVDGLAQQARGLVGSLLISPRAACRHAATPPPTLATRFALAAALA